MKYEPDELDYLRLLKEAKTLDCKDCKKVVRLAILADFSVQQLVSLLRVLASRNGIQLEVYEGGYDAIDAEIIDPASGLYAFGPDSVAILVAPEKLKRRFYEAADRASFARETAERFRGLWATLKERCAASVIQGNFVLPSERAFGSYELKAPDSMGSVFMEANAELLREARLCPHVLFLDVDHLAAEVGRRNWFDGRLWNLAKSPCRLEYLPLLAQGVADIVLAAAGQLAKCVVLDLDNTLWGGVIGDDGLEGIALGGFDEGEPFAAFQKFLRELKRRGVVLAVASKNDPANAVLPFQKHPSMVLREEDIAVFAANWNDKAENIRAIQKTLNIGFDSMVFLDDNAFERNLVRSFLPEVVVPEMPEHPALYLGALAERNLFETASYSEADRQRSDQYRQEARRETAKAGFTNIDDYLQSLDMKVRLERFNPSTLPRIVQLMQRSNQFNLATRRHSQAACEAFMGNPDSFAAFTLALTDKFGDHGLISAVILRLREEEIEIDEYLMSCRVLQRGVEHFAMNRIFELAGSRNAKRVVGYYLPTAKNGMVRDFYGGFGFQKEEDSLDGGARWALSTGLYQPKKTFLTPVAMEL